MTRTSSALKATRGARRKTIQNQRRVVAIEKLVRQLKHATGVRETAVSLQQALDKAAGRGVIHPNRSARLKSRFMRAKGAVAVATPKTTKKNRTSGRKKPLSRKRLPR